MSDDTTAETAPAETPDADVDEAPTFVAPEGHTHLLDESIREAAATPIVWDESLPADGIVEHAAPGEFVDSMQYSAAAPDDADTAPTSDAPAKKAAPRKAPAKKAPAKKAAAKTAGAKA